MVRFSAARSAAALAFVVWTAYAPASRAVTCRIEVLRTAPDRAHWGASCGAASVADPPLRVSRNQLDAVRICSALDPPCKPAAPGAEEILPEGVVLTEPRTGIPDCVSSWPTEWVRWGFVDIHRSCFRTLSDGDRGDLAAFRAAAGSEAAGTACSLERFEGFATAASLAPAPPVPIPGPPSRGPRPPAGPARPPVVPQQERWADDFTDDYPAAPLNPASSVYQAFTNARNANDSCLQRLNPALADRVSQAMGASMRGGTRRVIRPRLSCSEHEVYECYVADAAACDALRGRLDRIYRDVNSEDPRERVRTLVDHPALTEADCQPVPQADRLLGFTRGPAHPGVVDPGSPDIHLFETTARYDRRDEAAGTVLHEFLHAAGASQAANHNHGPLAGGNPPPGDQVYACEAAVFRGAFPTLSGAQLHRACLTCLRGGPTAGSVCGSPGNVGARLAAMGCRI